MTKYPPIFNITKHTLMYYLGLLIIVGALFLSFNNSKANPTE